MDRRPPRTTLTSTLCPYTTLFDLKGSARHPFVIGLAVIAVDKIGRDDCCIMAGNRSEWGSVRGSISGSVDGWTAHALQKFVELQLSVFDCDTALLEIEPLDGGSSSSRMDDEIGFDLDRFALTARVDHIRSAPFSN